ncbi:MAG TPA: glycosyltransferase family 4 protein [Thermoanaerobaculia bacterium]|nr:glycosyltransferase family 4 protein [Thermoanaerobaculia bacterium]
MNAPLRVLITVRSMEIMGGVESYVRDLARGLIRRGHQAVVYSTRLGAAASALRAETIPVIDDLERIGAAPDIIHGNSNLETLAALQRFPGVPAVFVCHSWFSWAMVPLQVPRVRRFVAVDDTCRDRLLLESGIPEERLAVLLNAVDLERFPRRGPLPPRPARALVFGNYANEMTHLDVVRKACARKNIAVDVLGFSNGNATDHPESVLGKYDLVFAKAKSALEAMATGSAVVLCDAMGLGPMVTRDALDRLRRLNFGIRTLDRALDAEELVREIERYDPADAARVTDAIRETAAHEPMIDALIDLYRQSIDEQRQAVVDPAEEALATSRYLQRLAADLGRPADSEQLFPVLGLANRILRQPFLGTPIRWIARRLAVKAR